MCCHSALLQLAAACMHGVRCAGCRCCGPGAVGAAACGRLSPSLAWACRATPAGTRSGDVRPVDSEVGRSLKQQSERRCRRISQQSLPRASSQFADRAAIFVVTRGLRRSLLSAMAAHLAALSRMLSTGDAVFLRRILTGSPAPPLRYLARTRAQVLRGAAPASFAVFSGRRLCRPLPPTRWAAPPTPRLGRPLGRLIRHLGRLDRPHRRLRRPPRQLRRILGRLR